MPNKVLAPSHTYIYGKKHTKDAGQGRAVYFDGVYYNPYTPLDYMAEYNVKRKNPEQFKPGGWIPQGPSNVFDTEHGVNSSAMLPWWDVEKVKIVSGNRTYLNPSPEQWSSIIPYKGVAALNLSNGSAVNNASVDVTLGTLSGNTKFFSRQGVGKVRYALALTDLGGGQKYRTAYRYQMIFEGIVNEKPIAFKKDVNLSNVANRIQPYFTDVKRFEVMYAEVQGRDRKLEYAEIPKWIMQIQAVQLGASFVGSVDDIANEEFWSTANQRREERKLPANYTMYRSYAYPASLGDNVPRVYKEDLYRTYGDHWGASYSFFQEGATAFFLGSSQVAIFGAVQGGWGEADVSNYAYSGLRFSVRPFTTQER